MSPRVGDMINSQIYSFVRLLRPRTIHISKMMFINNINFANFSQHFQVSSIFNLEMQWATQIQFIFAFVA